MNLSELLEELNEIRRGLQKILYEDSLRDVLEELTSKHGDKGVRDLNRSLEFLAKAYIYVDSARERLEKLREGRKK